MKAPQVETERWGLCAHPACGRERRLDENGHVVAHRRFEPEFWDMIKCGESGLSAAEVTT